MSLTKTINILKGIAKVSEEISNPGKPFYKKQAIRYAERIRTRLTRGLVQGRDIYDNPFEPLKQSTITVRRAKGIGGQSPLLAKNKAALHFLQSPNLYEIKGNTIFLNKPPQNYLMHQNVGFQPKYIPSQKRNGELRYKKDGNIQFRLNNNPYTDMKSVPARTWWGIPKGYKADGKNYEVFSRSLVKAIKKELSDKLRKG